MSCSSILGNSRTVALCAAFAFFSLTACGDDDSTGMNGGNTAPTADAGPNETTGLFETVTLDGLGNDPDGDDLTFTWSLTSTPTGSSATLSSTNTAVTTFMPDRVGAYEAELTVSDGSASDTDMVSLTATLGTCEDAVDAFPVPVSAGTSPFPSVDDSFLEIAFADGFDFTFYGQTYTSVFLNTNGGMTFGAGNDNFDEAADAIPQPGIAVFWGDMDAAEYEAIDRPDQFGYQVCQDAFVVTYEDYQDNDEQTWDNTATTWLFEDGKVVIEYGTVASIDILTGVFDGSHTDDQYLEVSSSYPDYFNTGTGIILLDDWGIGPSNDGRLDDQRVIFDPSAGAVTQMSVPSAASPSAPSSRAPQTKGPKF